MRGLPLPGRFIGFALLLPSLVLTHPAGSAADTKPATSSPKRAAVKTHKDDVKSVAAPADRCVHGVRRGESLSRIAARYHVARQSVITANHLTNPGALRAGQRLQIPGCKGVAPQRVARRESGAVPPPVRLDSESFLARVGPRRIPTRLFVAVPDFTGDGVQFQWPIDGPIASGFGRRPRGWHAGVDIKAEMGAPIRAAAAGTVLVSGAERFYGRMIKIEHAGGFTTTYAHNLENLVEVGDTVEAGALIGTVGRSGYASASHLHFEIRREGIAYNPLHLLDGGEVSVLASAPWVPLGDDEDRE
jgi:murein DD-endopeptidase MepM/ murein hydrolase activator NlpD